MNNTQSLQKGSVRKKGNLWYYRLRTEEPDGTWKMHEYKGTTSKRETQAILEEALRDLREEGIMFRTGNITVSQLYDLWWKDEIENSVLTVNGRKDYANVIRHIKEHELGSTLLKDVSCELLQAYVDLKYYGEYGTNGKQIKHAYSQSHMRKQFVVLNGIFKYAVFPKRFIKENPMFYVKRRKKEQRVSLFGDAVEKVATITHSEYEKIIDALSKSERDSYLVLPIQIAYHTGMRAGEVCGLSWEDIDLSQRQLIVRRSMYYNSDAKCWELKVPKNGKSRIIDFGDTLAQILMVAKIKQTKNRNDYGDLYERHFYQNVEIKGKAYTQIYTKRSSSLEAVSSRATQGRTIDMADASMPLLPLDFVCSKDNGEMLTTQTLKWCNKVVHDFCPDIPFHFHCLRHTYATTLVTAGANMKDVQELMGHSDIKITLNTYSHVTLESRRKAIDIFENAIASMR